MLHTTEPTACRDLNPTGEIKSALNVLWDASRASLDHTVA
jgi:hypothetical protein